MGCGCKGDNKSLEIPKEKVELSVVGNLLKIPTIILLTVLIIILSPVLLVVTWYIIMRTVFSDNFSILNFLLKNYRKLVPNKEELDEEDFDDEELDEDFNEDDYEIVGVDIIK